jgi:hypothetical protein
VGIRKRLDFDYRASFSGCECWVVWDELCEAARGLNTRPLDLRTLLFLSASGGGAVSEGIEARVGSEAKCPSEPSEQASTGARRGGLAGASEARHICQPPSDLPI